MTLLDTPSLAAHPTHPCTIPTMSSTETKDTYKAIQLVKLSKTVEEGIDNLQLNDVPRPKQLKKGELRVQIYAACVNFFDLLILIGQYQHKPKLPHTMGSEAAGKVIEVGEGVSLYSVGDNVIVPLSGDGGCMASECVLHESVAIPMPKTLSYAQAAGIGTGFITGYHGLVHRGNLKKGDYVLVTGAGGGMGLSACQIARALGATVIAVASTDEKCEVARKYGGAHHTINYTTTKNFKAEVERITEGHLVDVAYDVVGGKLFNELIRVMAPQARLLIIGFASGEIPKIPANLVLVKGFDVVGVRSGFEMRRRPELAMDSAQKLLELTDAETLKAGGFDIAPLVDYTYDMEAFGDAFRVLHQRKVVGKAAIVFHPEAAKIPAERSAIEKKVEKNIRSKI